MLWCIFLSHFTNGITTLFSPERICSSSGRRKNLAQWLESKKVKRGAALSIDQVWELSQRWYHNRLSLDYHGRTMEQVQEIFEELGLISEFWKVG